MSVASRGTIAMVMLAYSAVGCAPLCEPSNHRELIWQGARAEMHTTAEFRLPLVIGPEQGYDQLWINLDAPARQLRVRMPDGRWLSTTGLDPAAVELYASPLLSETRGSGARRLNVPFDRDDCSSWTGFTAGDLVFYFEADRLVQIQLTSNVEFPARCRPALGDGDGVASYPMPLSEEQLVEILGPYQLKRDYYGGL